MLNKSGYCVYFFAHRGIGRSIIKTDNMKRTKNQLIEMGDCTNIVCDVDRKKAIRKFNLSRKTKTKKSQKKKVINKKII